MPAEQKMPQKRVVNNKTPLLLSTMKLQFETTMKLHYYDRSENA